MKYIRLIALFCFLMTQGFASVSSSEAKTVTKAKSTLSPQLTIQQAKMLIRQGERGQAIKLINSVASKEFNKKNKAKLLKRRKLFAEQFLTSESFQKFQQARVLADLKRWGECLNELGGVKSGDLNNLLVLRLKAKCQKRAERHSAAEQTLGSILEYLPGDFQASLDLAEIALQQKKYSQGLSTLDSISSQGNTTAVRNSEHDQERYILVRAKLLEELNRIDEAIELLRKDQEMHLDHIRVLYELGMLYVRIGTQDWQARKMLSLFITRCKRLKKEELKQKDFDELLTEAEENLSALDKKLGV